MRNKIHLLYFKHIATENDHLEQINGTRRLVAPHPPKKPLNCIDTFTLDITL